MRCSPSRLALGLLALAACRPHGTAGDPRPRGARASGRADREATVLDLAVERDRWHLSL